MPKFMILANYTAEGTKGLMREGGTKRRSAVEDAVKSFGGRVEGFYFALGDVDAILIVDAPDAVSVATMSLAVNASGLVQTKTVALLTAEDLDQAVKKSFSYRGPGQ
jgi:uncharacterized protein with GYD domain